LAGLTSSFAFAGMHPDKCLVEFPDHVPKRRPKRPAASDQDIIMTVAQAFRARKPHEFAQSAPDPVALHGISDLPRHCVADAYPVFVGAPARLQYECIAAGPHSGSGSAKIRSAFQPVHMLNNARTGKPRPLRTESLASPGPPRRHNLLAAPGRHTGTKTMAALAHQLARLIGSFHEIVSADALGPGPAAPTLARKRAFGAAYTGPLLPRQSDGLRPNRVGKPP
jgi:hypothetical protein